MSFEKQRQRMVATQLRTRFITDDRVLKAMAEVPRELFVPEDMHAYAYDDGPLYIGYGQTISQPYMVARMVELLELKGDEKVLEVGSGSGYEAAVLACCAKEVYTIERIPELVRIAQNNLARQGYDNVQVIAGDGSQGLISHAPYDGIIVAAGASTIPPALTEQLALHGKLVIPLGTGNQIVTVLTKTQEGLNEEHYDACRFVPLIV